MALPFPLRLRIIKSAINFSGLLREHHKGASPQYESVRYQPAWVL